MRAHRLATITVAAAALLLGSTAPAIATSGSDAAPFAAQATAAHLTTSQTNSLRAEVRRIMATTGGKQVALNKIDLNGQGNVLVAIPGEAHPRNLPTSSADEYDHCTEGDVYSGYFCAYASPSYQGTEIQMFACKAYPIPWVGNGSWINDQYPGTQARFYNNSGTKIFTTPVPFSWNTNYSTWTNVHTIWPC